MIMSGSLKECFLFLSFYELRLKGEDMLIEYEPRKLPRSREYSAYQFYTFSAIWIANAWLQPFFWASSQVLIC